MGTTPLTEAAMMQAASLWISYLSDVQNQASVVPTATQVDLLLACGQGEQLLVFALQQLEAQLELEHVPRFWSQLAQCQQADVADCDQSGQEQQLLLALETLVSVVDEHCGQLARLADQLLHSTVGKCAAGRWPGSQAALQLAWLPRQYRTSACALLMASAKLSLSDTLQQYFGTKLQQLSAALKEHGAEELDTPSAHSPQANPIREGLTGGAAAGCGADDTDTDMVPVEVTSPVMGTGSRFARQRAAASSPGSSGMATPSSSSGWHGTTELRRSTTSTLAGKLGARWVSHLQRVCSCCHSLALESAAEEAYTAVVSDHVAAHLAATASRVFDRPVLPAAVQYVSWVPLEFLKLLLMPSEAAHRHRQSEPGGTAAAGMAMGDVVDASTLLNEWRLRLTYYLYETLGTLRIQEMFDIVVEYPDSLPAIRDAARCLCHTNLADHFVASFRKALQQRLLHAGVPAVSIIHQYVSTIRALKQMDPSGGLLSAVAQPIREYLRGRPDTIRCLVTMVTAEGGDGAGGGGDGAGLSLLEELQRGGTTMEVDNEPSAADSDEAAYRAIMTPSDSALVASTSGRAELCNPGTSKGEDIVSSLIGVFGSTDIFLDEYRSMLGGRLVYASDYDCDGDIRTVELLKLRFGEAALHSCEVMLKDVADSKRLFQSIHIASGPATAAVTTADGLGVLSATIMSYLYWPQGQLEEDKPGKVTAAQLILPPAITQAMDFYAAHYQRLKSPRALSWRTSLGVVELELCVGDVEVAVHVSPAMATILLQFQDHEQMTATQIAAAVGLPVAAVRRKLMFWVNEGILLEGRGTQRGLGISPQLGEPTTTFQRATHLDSAMHGTVLSDFCAEEEGASGPAALLSATERLMEEMGMYENYVMGMLTNYKALPLDRLHKMLQLFVVSPRFDKSTEQLAAFLSLLQAQDKVTCENGLYRTKAGAAAATAAAGSAENAH